MYLLLIPLSICIEVAGWTIQSFTPASGFLSRQPIQVIFSDPIIKFGSDITDIPREKAEPVLLSIFRNEHKTDQIKLASIGRWRYLTTTIARFDVHESLDFEWPTNLFVEAVVNSGLKSAAGEAMDDSAKASEKLGLWYTNKLDFYIDKVISEMAASVTDNGWTSIIKYTEEGQLHEAPSDAVIQVRITGKISLALVSVSGFFRCGDTSAIVKGPCSSTEAQEDISCVHLTLASPLADGEHCRLLPSNTLPYHPLAGYFQGDKPLLLSGVVPFVFGPFLESDYRRTQSRSLKMLIRHGLPVDTDLSSVISISPELEGGFSAVVTVPTVVLIQGKFEPNDQYTISIAESKEIVDNFGKALEASEGTINVGREAQYLLFYWGKRHTVVHLHPEDPLSSFPVIARGKEGSWASSCIVDESNLWDYVEVVFLHYFKDEICSDNKVDITETGKVATPLIFGSTSLNLIRISESSGRNSFLLLTNIDLHVAVTTIASGPSTTAHLLVTRLSSGTPIANARVEARRVYVKPSRSIFQGMTDASGVAIIKGECSGCAIVVQVGPEYLVVDTLLHTYEHEASREFHVQLAIDRAIYTPGETVALSGWTFEVACEGGQNVCAIDPADIGPVTIQAEWSSDRGTSPTMYDVEVQADGSFSLELEVPPDAEYGYRPRLIVAGPFHQEPPSFVIADPRVPSAILAVEAPSYLLTKGSVGEPHIEAVLTTFTGIPLAGIEVEISGELRTPGECHSEGESEASVSTSLKTDNEGKVQAALFALFSSSADVQVRNGQTIEIFVRTVDPTGSPLAEKAEILVVDSIYILEDLSLSVDPPFPSIPFALSSSLQSHYEKETPLPQIGAVEFAFVEGSTCAEAVFPEEGTPCQTQGSSIICEDLVLNSAEEHVASVVKVTLDNEETLTACRDVGMPLVYTWHTQLSLKSSVLSVPAGETVEISFYHPFVKEKALLWVFGSQGLVHTAQLSSSAKQSIMLSVPDSARKEEVFIFYVRSVGGGTEALPVGKSKVSALLATWGPRSAEGKITIDISSVRQALKGPLSVSAPTTASPGGTVEVEIDVGAGNNGRAFIYLVDSAVLDLQPHPLSSLPKLLPHVTVYIHSYTVPNSGQRIQDASLSLAELIRLDPFIYVDWSSMWLDGDVDEILQERRFGIPITEGNFPPPKGYLLSLFLSSLNFLKRMFTPSLSLSHLTCRCLYSL